MDVKAQIAGWLGFSQEAATQKVAQEVAFLKDENWRIQESYRLLELELENEGYARLTAGVENAIGSPHERHRLTTIIKLARQMAVKNPLTNRSVNVQADYVFGQGIRFVAKDAEVQEWVDEFVDYPPNRKALTGPTAMRRQERSLQIEGQRFIGAFTNRVTGRVQARVFNTLEIQDIIRDPDDHDRHLFYQRDYSDMSGKSVTVYYPAWGITEQTPGLKQPWEYQFMSSAPRGKIEWDIPVYHLVFNIFGVEKFAVPEVYPQLDWALAYKRFLEDWTSIIRSFARMALKLTGLSGKKGIAAAKSQLGTAVNIGGNLNETNPSAVGGSVGLFSGDKNIEAVKTAGATTPAKEGTPVLAMAATSVGLPTAFFGDGGDATKLDRPTELKMIARQELWREFWTAFLAYVVEQRAMVEKGVDEETDAFTGVVYLVAKDDDTDMSVECVFPPILERNVTDRVRALVNAVTQFGKPLSDIIPDKTLVSRLLMEALNIPDIDAKLPGFLEMWKANMKVGDDGKPVDPNIIPPLPSLAAGGAEDPSQGGDTGANG